MSETPRLDDLFSAAGHTGGSYSIPSTIIGPARAELAALRQRASDLERKVREAAALLDNDHITAARAALRTDAIDAALQEGAPQP